ncbi:MAG: hypothetical protein ACFFAU_16295 [Candidatus Hodarchaeota archaeon]
MTHELEHYVRQEDLLPILFPFYTPESLKIWITLGVVAGFPNTLTRIQTELESNDEGSLLPDLYEA